MSNESILSLINQFDKSYSSLNKSLNCFTYNISDYAKSNLTKSHDNNKLKGKLIAVKDNINIKDYKISCTSNI